jgi:hypothetical protein
MDYLWSAGPSTAIQVTGVLVQTRETGEKTTTRHKLHLMMVERQQVAMGDVSNKAHVKCFRIFLR